MQKIATPQDLRAELNRLLAYCEGSAPSREKLASELQDLADRVAGVPKAEVSKVMAKALEEAIRKMGKDEFKKVLEAAKYGVFRDDGGDKERLAKLKKLQNVVVHRVWRVAGQAKHSQPTDIPMSSEAGVWFMDQKDNAQYTMSRQLIMQEAKKLGIKLDRKKLI